MNPAARTLRSTFRHFAAAGTVVAALGLAGPATANDLRLELVRESLTGTHCRWRIYEAGLPTDDYVTTPCAASAAAVDAHAPVRGLFRRDGRTVRRTLVEEGPGGPWLHDVDPANGEVLRRVPWFFQKHALASGAAPHAGSARLARDETAYDAVPAAASAVPALVFDPNPVAALDDPTLQDRDDASSAVPGIAYRSVTIEPAVAAGSLRGRWIALVDRQAPSIPPPDAGAPLVFDRGQDGFEAVNAFFHVERNQDHLRSLGYTGSRSVAAYAVEVDAHALNGADNSFFLPSPNAAGRGTLYFGVGGTDDAEDADLIVHEYGHALLEWIAPGTFGGAFASESRALSEGFCDYWAYSAHHAARLASGRDPFCFADWDARCWEDAPSEQCAYPPGSDCLRRLDSQRTMADYRQSDAAGTEHANGTIWSSALREIHRTLVSAYGLEPGRRIADTMVIESMFGAPPRPTYAVMARRLLDADRLLNGGAHIGTICAAMTARGILETCGALPRGEFTLFQTAARDVPIPENDVTGVEVPLAVSRPGTIESVLVRVDVDHPSRGDLRIELIAPDGATVLLQQVSAERTPGVHVTFGLDADPVEPLSLLRGRNAEGVWRLRIRDLRARDTGRLRSWGLQIRYEGDAPLAERPRGDGQMVPVVTHVYGASGTAYRSDVRLANPSRTAVDATLVFTPSGMDGRTSFGAIRVRVEPGRTVALDDVVRSAFGATGSGSLEVLGDVVTASRTRNVAGEGEFAQQVPVRLETTAAGEPQLFVAGLDAHGYRFNLGVTETSGNGGVVRILHGSTVTEIAILPWSHVQFGVAEPHARVSVTGGGARVVAYLSQVDAANGDAMFVPGLTLRTRSGIAPAMSATGVDGTSWVSDLWLVVREPALPHIIDVTYRTAGEEVALTRLDPVQLDVVATSLGRPGTAGALLATLPAEAIAHTRVRGGETNQYVPFLDPEGGTLQHLVFVENAEHERTNVGIVSAGEAMAVMTVFDAAGNALEQQVLGTERGLAQTAVRVGVRGGRAEVRFERGTGRAWASLVDGRTRDATLTTAP